MPPGFSVASLRFLRALKRNNDRDWFRARRDEYDRVVRGPMIAIIEQLAVDFGRFAPEMIASPKTSLYRVYRDTRFSADKTPLKTHVSASFRWRGLPKGGGAGLYLEVDPRWTWIGRRLLFTRAATPGSDPRAYLRDLPRDPPPGPERQVPAGARHAGWRSTDTAAQGICRGRSLVGIPEIQTLPRWP